MIISHGADIHIDIEARKQEILSNSQPILPHEQELEMLEALCDFDLGRFLLANRGLNGYWTAYCILNHKQARLDNPLEQWLLTKAPGMVATQERFDIFQDLLQDLLQPNMHLASLPCGAMDDLLGLDYSNANHCRLTGIDLDLESLKLAEQNAQTKGIENVHFDQRDAWALDIEHEFDVLTSNGLNIYEGNKERLVALYKQFYQAIKPGGHLITSYINPPPTMDPTSPVEPYNDDDFIKQAALFGDVIKSGWQWFQTEMDTRNQLERAGFVVEKIVFDHQMIFPTVLAKRLG